MPFVRSLIVNSTLSECSFISSTLAKWRDWPLSEEDTAMRDIVFRVSCSNDKFSLGFQALRKGEELLNWPKGVVSWPEGLLLVKIFKGPLYKRIYIQF